MKEVWRIARWAIAVEENPIPLDKIEKNIERLPTVDILDRPEEERLRIQKDYQALSHQFPAHQPLSVVTYGDPQGRDALAELNELLSQSPTTDTAQTEGRSLPLDEKRKDEESGSKESFVGDFERAVKIGRNRRRMHGSMLSSVRRTNPNMIDLNPLAPLEGQTLFEDLERQRPATSEELLGLNDWDLALGELLD
ncbi:hypothetical protein ABW19_dt0204638 [Dactylella cylindrospora]|nr:hypothetical protein ABW19_dt0204638 [Dactylella cylindrospora]